MQIINQKEFRAEKVIKRKGDKKYVKWKGFENSFNIWIDKKDTVQVSEYFPTPKSLGGKVKVELDLPNYATKADLKNAPGVDITKSSKKVDMASLKLEIDKSDIGKLETTPVDLRKLSDVIKNEVAEKTVHDKLLKKINAIQTNDASNLVKKMTTTQHSLKMKRKYLIMIIINILLHKNLIS